ncbi:hypothetical protein [uncultured Roseobacter sp.]|uniref:hypothetical protein n=1 Tax=uncultured Roseobacter sp. TaxID=114847 RepID=UPI002626919C|nr:hypothetical protein [uncultured Roseobacter sp.]
MRAYLKNLWIDRARPVCAVSAVCVAALAGSVQAETSARQATFGNWGVYVEEEPRPKTCWAATILYDDLEADQSYFLAVTQFNNNANPQVSIFSNKRMPRSVGIFINVAGRDYRMRSDGTSAWLSNRHDNLVLREFLQVSNNRGRVRAGSKGFAYIDVDMTGFSRAFDLMMKECGRR